MPIRLLVKSKAETGDRPPQEVVLNQDTVTLGRDKTCEVMLNDQVVSRRHALIIREGALYFVEDTGSSFGTRINGAQLPANEKRLLKNGDVIAIGPFDVTFDRIADAALDDGAEKTSYVAKRVVKDALRGLASGGATPYLRVMNGPLEGKRFEVHEAGEVVIGREEGVTVLLDNDDLASRRHAKVRRDWSGITVEDLGSRNGIKVNRKKATTAQLKDRDEIEVGSTRFLFLDPSEVREAPVVPELKPSRVSKVMPAKKEAEPLPKEPEASQESPVPEKADEPPEPAPKAEEPKSEEVEKPEEPEEPQSGESSAPESLADAADGTSVDSDGPQTSPMPSDPGPPPEPQRSLKGQFASRDGLRSLLPLIIVVSIALIAVTIFLVTLFAL